MNRRPIVLAFAGLSLAACTDSEAPLRPIAAPPAALAVVTGSQPGTVASLMGPMQPVSQTEALGGAFARYESDFRTQADLHWITDGARWYDANYYDRAMIYYVWWARTGNATYLSRATQLAVGYRDGYLNAIAHFRPPFHQYMPGGVALHYLLTGDARSRAAIGAVADVYAGAYTMKAIGVASTPDMDAREQERVLRAFLYAHAIGAPSVGLAGGIPGGNDWSALLRTALSRILATQAGDGAFRYAHTCNYSKPFMTGLLLDAMIQYYRVFEPDPRIPPAVKRAVDYLWDHDWIASAQAFTYIEGDCAATSEKAGPAPDLNNLVTSAFGFAYASTHDPKYLSRGDQAFAGGVAHAWLAGTKQFNEEYHDSFRYLGFRAGVTPAPSAPDTASAPPATPSPSVAPLAFNFRRSASFVADQGKETFVSILHDAYPTTRNGATFGWLLPANRHGDPVVERDGYRTGDRRLAGAGAVRNVNVGVFRVTLPGPGTYRIRLAVGSPVFGGSGQTVRLLDGTTQFAVVGKQRVLSAGRFLDATGAELSAARWSRRNAFITRKFTTSTFALALGRTSGRNRDYTAVAHLSLEPVR